MLRGVQFIGFSAITIATLITLAGCGHNFYGGEREAWRREAEIACLTSGAFKESPSRVRISPISGPGICGADYPIQVSALGDSGPLGYTDEPVRPPAALADRPIRSCAHGYSTRTAGGVWIRGPGPAGTPLAVRARSTRRDARGDAGGRRGDPTTSGQADVALCAGRAGPARG
jgi:hypothetical protein